jgi:hypothetical protein
MKFINVLGLAAAGYLGYLLEPSLRPALTGQALSKIESGKDKKVILRLPGDLPQIDLASLTPDQLPAKVLLKSDVTITDAASGTQMIMPAGNRAKLVRIEGANAVVSPGEGAFLGLVSVTDTDLFQLLAANPPSAQTTTVSESPAASDPAPEPQEEFVKTPVAPPTPEPTPEPVPETTATEEATTNADDAPLDDPEQTVKAMQTSIKNGQVKEFTYDQILEWQADADEIVDGETYQTGLAAYKAETIFGTKMIQAKALIKAGKVQRWIWPKSGAEIK